MDDPNLDPELHRLALNGLKRINWVTRSVNAVWMAIQALADANRQAGPISVLDIGCGSGDSLIKLGENARNSNLNLKLSGMDIGETAVEMAGRNAAQADLEMAVTCRDALTDEPFPQHDVVFCSLFLHHLRNEQAAILLKKMRDAAREMVLVSDLVRSHWGYLIAMVGTRILSRSHIVHVDGPRSVEAAFSVEEIRQLALDCELPGATIRRFWPQRFLLQWKRDGLNLPTQARVEQFKVNANSG